MHGHCNGNSYVSLHRLRQVARQALTLGRRTFLLRRAFHVHGERIEIRGFGTFKVRERRARRARNPRSGTEVMVPAKLVPVFKPSKELKSLVIEPSPTAETVAS